MLAVGSTVQKGSYLFKYAEICMGMMSQAAIQDSKERKEYFICGLEL